MAVNRLGYVHARVTGADFPAITGTTDRFTNAFT